MLVAMSKQSLILQNARPNISHARSLIDCDVKFTTRPLLVSNLNTYKWPLLREPEKKMKMLFYRLIQLELMLLTEKSLQNNFFLSG